MLRTGLSKGAFHAPQTTGKQRGYALLLMLVLVTMGILFTVVSQVSLVGMKWGREYRTHATLLQAKEALIGYAATYRDTHSGDVFGYLPCPDIRGDGSADALSSDCGGPDGKTVIGLLPYKQLGLASNQDADGNCLWYAVSGTFKASASSVSPYNLPIPMNWDTQGQIEVRDANYNILTTPDDNNGGAAAVIFSVGPPLSSQSRLANTPTVPCGISSSAKANTVYTNYIDVDPTGIDHIKSQPFPGAANGTVRVTQGISGSSANNDQIAWITPKEIWNRFRQRSDMGGINGLTTAVGTVLQNTIVNSMVSATGTSPSPTTLPQSATTYTSPTNSYSGQAGQLPDVSASLDSSLQNYFTNWQEQYGYAVCSNLCGYCLTVNGQQCNGALLFGGTDVSGNPRAAGARNISNLFEDSGAKLLLEGSSASFSGASSYVGGSADVGVCVAPKTTMQTQYFTSACDTGSLNKKSSASSLPAAKVNTSTGTITLGYSGGSGGAVAGCVWTSSAFSLNSELRVYFQVNMLQNASGITFAIIDSNQQSSPTPCGGEGAYLGYGGTSIYFGNTPINPPKIGLALDTFGSSTGFNDPPYQSASLVYWGSTSTYDDDNKHHVAGDSGFPPNLPYPGTSFNPPNGVSEDLSSLFSNGTFHVRMDLSRTNCGTTGTATDTCNYTINVWTLTDAEATSALQDLSTAYSGGQPKVIDAFKMKRYYGGVEALKNVRFGFTSGQASGNQNVLISNLVIHVLP